MPGTRVSTAEAFDWSHEDRYISNDGKGPLVARILCVSRGVADMERWPLRGGARVRFTLPVKFLRSTSCGWRKK